MNATHVCPWWAGYTLNNRVRRLLHRPERILDGLIRPGMTTMDIGCGMGFFTLPMAGLVGETGRVIAVDLQEKMLRGMNVRAKRAGLDRRITAHQCHQNTMGIEDCTRQVDFALLFMMLHEVPDQQRLIRELRAALGQGGKVLFAEPIVHVSKGNFLQSLSLFRQEGFQVVDQPRIAICHVALLEADQRASRAW